MAVSYLGGRLYRVNQDLCDKHWGAIELVERIIFLSSNTFLSTRRLGVMRPRVKRAAQIRVHSQYTSNLFMFTMMKQAMTPFPRPLHYVCVGYTSNSFHICKAESTPRKLATATQSRFPRIVIRLSWTHVNEWSSANWGVLSIWAGPFSNIYVQLRLITLFGNCGCVAFASFLGVPSPLQASRNVHINIRSWPLRWRNLTTTRHRRKTDK
jgi:hypothetical protein